jgi:predicted ATPase/class 3 adenylate cyclase
VQDRTVTTFLFTDIEGSTRLWEQEPDRMHDALARHDAISRRLVVDHHGEFVKTTGDGVHAVFADPQDALRAAVALQLALADSGATAGIELRVRCGLHAGVDNRRDNDFYGNAVNRAARIMSAAHGGQILLSSAVATLVRAHLPEEVSLRDLGIVRLRDLANPEQVSQVVHPRLRQDFPALRSLAATPHNLPHSLTSFIGREHELAETRRQLSQTRLLTLVGIGGLGKSRLSLQTAADVLDEYPDGVWFVELAPVTDPRLVPQVVASVLGVKEEAGHPVGEALRKFVTDRRLLLVLDNCEHLAQACAELARELLEAGPHVRILASSRERLNIRGEKTYPLAPLAVPLPRQNMRPEGLATFAAARLFVERARDAQPDFAVTAENATAVAEICHRLDGIPLALELAAARVRAMSVDTIASRLSDRFKLLRGGDRTAMPRQQTLRALIDWSYELLTDDERTLFGRLSVFAGGFTLEAAEKVGSGGSIAEADVLDLLAGLVEKSLVTLDVEHDRYGMLETVRQYALEKLENSGEMESARVRHLDCFLSLAECAAPEWIGPRQRYWLEHFDAERENIMVAHRCCDRIAEGGLPGLRLVRAMRFYCFNRGLLALGYEITLEALARPGAQYRHLARCRALSDAGQFAVRMGQDDDALRLLSESLAIARELGDMSRVAITLQPLGQTHLARNEMARARDLLSEALALAEMSGNKREIAAALSSMALLHRVEQNFPAAEPVCERCLAIARELNDSGSIAVALMNLAMVVTASGNVSRPRTLLKEAQQKIGDVGSRLYGQALLEVVAGVAAAAHEWELAARLYGAAEHEAAQSGLKRDRADAAFLMERISEVRGALSAEAFREAEGAGRALRYELALVEARSWLAQGS